MDPDFQQATTDDLARPEEANAMNFRLTVEEKPRARRAKRTATTPMQATLISAIALGEKQLERANERTTELRELLGSAAPKEYERVWVYFVDVDVEGIEEEALLEDAADMKASADVLGIMNDPNAERGPDGRWHIIAGRRRFLTRILQSNDLPESGMAMEGDPKVGTWVMSPIGGLNDFESALATIAENHNRRAAWIRDVAKVRMLESRGFLEPQIIRLLALGTGKSANEVKPLVRIAFLPYAFVKLVLAGRMSQKTAKLLCGLPKHVLDVLEVKAKEGEAVTVEDIKAAKQVGASDTFAQALDFVGDIPAEPASEEGEFDAKKEIAYVGTLLDRVRRSDHPRKGNIGTMLNAIIVELSRAK